MNLYIFWYNLIEKHQKELKTIFSTFLFKQLINMQNIHQLQKRLIDKPSSFESFESYYNYCKSNNLTDEGILILSRNIKRLNRFAYLYLAVFYNDIKNYKQAENELKQIQTKLENQFYPFQNKFIYAWLTILASLYTKDQWRNKYEGIKQLMKLLKKNRSQSILLDCVETFINNKDYEISYFLIGKLISLSQKNPLYQMLRVQVLVELDKIPEACLYFNNFSTFQKNFKQQRVDKMLKEGLYQPQHLTKAKEKYDKLLYNLKEKILATQNLETEYKKIRNQNQSKRQYCSQMLVYTQSLISKYRNISYQFDQADDIKILTTQFSQKIDHCRSAVQVLNMFISDFPFVTKLGKIMEEALKKYRNMSNSVIADLIKCLFRYCDTGLQSVVMQMIIYLFKKQEMDKLLQKRTEQLKWYCQILKTIKEIPDKIKQFVQKIVKYLQQIGQMQDESQERQKQRVRLRLLAQHHSVQINLTMVDKNHYQNLIELVDIFERPMIFGVLLWIQEKSGNRTISLRNPQSLEPE